MESDQRGFIDRRRAIRLAGLLLVVPLAGIWNALVRREQDFFKTGKISLPLQEIADGISYYEDIVIVRQGNDLQILSLNCTHLGCKLKQSGNGLLICPCHGSVFNPENGDRIKGPAEKSLKRFEYLIEKDQVTIYLT